jgi:Family of unknown function (DUF5317)
VAPRADAVMDMILGLVFIACVLSVPLARGRLSALGELNLRHGWLALAGIGVQILIISVVTGIPGWLSEAVHMLSYVLLGAFAWVNRRIPGVPVILAGGLLNFIAIAANGGVMPADPEIAVKMAGEGGFQNSGGMGEAHLLFLGDIFATPSWFPLYNVYSVGDAVIVLGVLILLHGVCGTRLVPRRWRVAAPAGA